MEFKECNVESRVTDNKLSSNENSSNIDDQYYSIEYKSKNTEDNVNNLKAINKPPYKYDEKLMDSDITYEELALVVGEKSEEYYLLKWTNMEKNKKALSWNWSAFIFNYYWFFHRKMYSYGIVLLCVSFLLNLINSYFNVNLNIFFLIVTGCFSNIIYKKHTIKKINKIKFKILDYEEQRQLLLKSGGTNWIFTIILAFFNFALLLSGIIKIAAMSLQYNF